MKFAVMIITAVIIFLTAMAYFRTTKNFITEGSGGKPGTDARIENAQKSMEDLNKAAEEQLNKIEESTR